MQKKEYNNILYIAQCFKKVSCGASVFFLFLTLKSLG